MCATLHIGCAGWVLPRAEQSSFPAEGTHLHRYAARFRAVEINSSFHRPHRQTTYARWAAAVPDDFRFSVKVPRAISHSARLAGADELLGDFLEQISGLGTKLGCILLQLPPSLALDVATAKAFLEMLRDRQGGAVAIEPRHASWATDEATRLLVDYHIARVVADPVLIPGGGEPGGWPEIVYYRLHGSPRIYYSPYDDAYLRELASRLGDAMLNARDVWCIFDNTVRGAATANALVLVNHFGND